MEKEFSVTIYPLADAEQIERLREALQDAILKVVEEAGLYMGAVWVDAVRVGVDADRVGVEEEAEVENGEKTTQ